MAGLRPYFEHDGISVYLGDCREVLPALGLDGAVDLVLTDPPYGIRDKAAFWRAGGDRVEDNADEGWNAIVGWDEWLPAAAALLKDGGHIASFHDMTQIEATLGAMRRAGVAQWSRFWFVKPNPPVCPRPAFQSGIEEMVIAEKRAPGTPRSWHGGGTTPNYWLGQPATRDGFGHPCEKPLGALNRVLSALSPEGGLVVDPFMGSGSTLRSAKDLGRRAVGIEKDEKWCELAAKRMAQGVLFAGAGGAA
jgi:site-specific DNA-methyltransferase (adenine-specific)